MMIAAAFSAVFLPGAGLSQSMTSELKSKVEARVKQYGKWSTDPVFVAAVKAHNNGLTAEDKAMTNAKWAELSLLDPYVRTFTKNPLGVYLKSKKTDEIAECFVSGADGTKVAFLGKSTYWCHADKDKHKVPMTGRDYIGPIAMDDSTGQQLVQIGLPVLDVGKPIGSIVIGLAVSKLQ
jgi:hypothetical protein